ncbi:replication protein RepA [Cellvibrio sp. KY-GH-1]|uniref:replication protein RepA n=1 Tax=Cellvibrio sp. KY-GH-1 TaxID=2303332 RepID=UPI001782388C|nr:replication protein RepA [Cellvibrio sp. KY-GH-1]
MKSKKIKLTQRDIKLIDQSIAIKDCPATIEQAGFMFTLFCQLGFPRSHCDQLYFFRECGKARLVLDAEAVHIEGNLIQASLPYGVLPRLILLEIFSCAVRYKTKKIDLGSSAASFIRRLGLRPAGGKRGNYANLKNQLGSLLALHVECDFNVKGKRISFCGKLFSDCSLVNEKDKSWHSVINLSDDFYDVLVTQRNAVPVDTRAISALKGSALALDIYSMLVERLHRASAKPVTLYWKNLREQFASEYIDNENGKRSFKENFLIALKKVKMVYPVADIQAVSGGVCIRKSPPPIPKK